MAGCLAVMLRETLYGHCSGLLRHRALKVNRDILGRCLEMEGHSVVTVGGIDYAWLLLRSPRAELF